MLLILHTFFLFIQDMEYWHCLCYIGVRAAIRLVTYRMENTMDHDTYSFIFCTMFARRFPGMSMVPWVEQRRYEVSELLATMAGMIIVVEK